MKSLPLSTVTAFGLACSLTLTGCGSSSSDSKTESVSAETLSSGFAAVDQNYVPALLFSNISPTPNSVIAQSAQMALTSAQSQWNSFKTSTTTSFNGKELNSYYSTVDSALSSASEGYASVIAAADYPADVSAIHDSLESVRDTLASMRETIGSSYFMDAVTTAHHAMEPVAGAAKTYSGDQDLNALCTSLQSSLPAFESAWQTLQNGYDETSVATLYGMSSAKAANLTANVNAMGATLGSLDTALEGCDSSVAGEAGKIKPIFVKFFLSFGDFLAPFQADMIAMEQAFIPVLYCTNNPPDGAGTCGDINGTQQLLSTYESHYGTFKAHFPELSSLNLPALLYWKTDLDTIATSFANAKSIIEGGTDMAGITDAHTEMEAVRTAMYNLRATYENYGFVIDDVTAYHNKMEPIALAVKGLTDASQVTTEISTAISAALPDAQSSLSSLKSAVDGMDATAFGFDSAWLTSQQSSIASQQANLESLATALADENTADILTYASQVKPYFVPFFKAFGNF